MKIGLITVSSKLGFKKAQKLDAKICSGLENVLDRCYGAIHEVEEDILGEISKTNFLLINVATGGTEGLIYELVKNSEKSVLLTTMFNNSFPAALEAKSLLIEEGYKVDIVSLEEFDLNALKQVLDLLKWMYGKKVLLIGEPSPWLIYSKPNIEAIYQKFGLILEMRSLEEIIERSYRASASEEIMYFKKQLKNFSPEELEKIGRLHKAIEGLLGEEYIAFSIRCFDIINRMGVTVCLSVSKFNDLGIVAGCEGDIPSTISMILGLRLSGKPTFMGNTVDVRGEEILLAHCTIATHLTKNYRLITHFESRRGISIAGTVEKGVRVTVFKLGRDMDKIYVGSGKIVEGEPKYDDMCRTQIKIKLDNEAKNFLEKPLGNHLVIAFKDIYRELKLLSKIVGIEFKDL